MELGQGPPQARTRQSSLHVWVFRDIFVVIGVEELVVVQRDRGVRRQGQDGEGRGRQCHAPETGLGFHHTRLVPYRKTNEPEALATAIPPLTLSAREVSLADAEQVLFAANKQAIIG